MVTLLIFVNYILTLFLVGGALTGYINPIWSMVALALLIYAEYRVYHRTPRAFT